MFTEMAAWRINFSFQDITTRHLQIGQVSEYKRPGGRCAGNF